MSCITTGHVVTKISSIEVGVESEPGCGSTFWAKFPLCDAPGQSEDLSFEVKSWLLEQSDGETGIDEEDALKVLDEYLTRDYSGKCDLSWVSAVT